MRWARTIHGEFSTKSAWELCRQRLPQSPVLKLIWSEHLLPSMSIFIWMLLANRIPVDAKLQWRKISLASKCRCCRSPDFETREHLFLQGEVARAVWEMVATWFPNLPRWNVGVTNLEARISFWHRRLCQPDRTHASAVIPGLVLWLIWSERNSCIHRNTSFNASNIFNRIKNYLQQLITAGKMGKEQWRGCDNNENLITSMWRGRPRKQIRQVKWIPPDPNWIKINTTGIWSESEAGAGGIIRDNEGNILRGFMEKISATSALDAELQALSRGLDIAREHGRHMWVELNAKEAVSLLVANKFGAANLRHQITDIRNKLKQVEVKITHILIQGNKVAEFLAQQGNKGRGLRILEQEAIPAMAKALARMDQLGLPSFSLRELDDSR